MIDIREILAGYHSTVEDFHIWFVARIRALQEADYTVVSGGYADLLRSRKESNAAAFEARLKLYESGKGSLFDVLNPFMTPADSAELYL